MSSKAIEPETGYGSILQLSEAEAAMREHRIRRPRPCALTAAWAAVSTSGRKDRHILKVAPEHGPANGISTCVKGKVWLGSRQ